MRWNGGLGSFPPRDIFLISYLSSSCFCRFDFHSMRLRPTLLPLVLLLPLCPSVLILRFSWLSWGSGVVVVVVAGFPGGASSFPSACPSKSFL